MLTLHQREAKSLREITESIFPEHRDYTSHISAISIYIYHPTIKPQLNQLIIKGDKPIINPYFITNMAMAIEEVLKAKNKEAIYRPELNNNPELVKNIVHGIYITLKNLLTEEDNPDLESFLKNIIHFILAEEVNWEAPLIPLEPVVRRINKDLVYNSALRAHIQLLKNPTTKEPNLLIQPKQENFINNLPMKNTTKDKV